MRDKKLCRYSNSIKKKAVEEYIVLISINRNIIILHFFLIACYYIK